MNWPLYLRGQKSILEIEFKNHTLIIKELKTLKHLLSLWLIKEVKMRIANAFFNQCTALEFSL